MEARKQRCKARLSNGSRGCKRWAMTGQDVCAHHGGKAPQSLAAARRRMAELLEPALQGLRLALEKGDLPTIVRAATVVLDRCGLHPRQAVELTGADGGPIETQTVDLSLLSTETLERVLAELRDGKPWSPPPPKPLPPPPPPADAVPDEVVL